ncbi:MAG: ABC transporter transmembrane domain-containing protein, partial [Alphaproteobacteria bacterium]|nr:ABC transporter transmembrane domain-containing protein [Alphaproteobacteria bacterium]
MRFFGMPGDPAQIRHEYGRPGQPLDATQLLRAAKGLRLKARSIGTTWLRLEKTPLPAIARLGDGRFVILAQVDGDKALVQDPLQQRPLTLSREEFEQAWSGELVLVARRASPLGRGGKFDVRWFVPAIVRYKRLFSEVLVASFFVQIFALVTPLFFMVVIDKVLVHRGLTTLDVLVIGLLVVSVFEVILGTLRTYIFSHTTNRIDVELGAKLFRHLLGLPLAYFESRRTGDSVARVRELDSIRNFLTGSALTLVIDLFFTFVFLIVMWQFSRTLTLIVLGLLPFYVILSALVTPVMRGRLEEKFQRGAANQAFLVESVAGVETLKAMAVEPEMQRRWEDQLAAYVNASFKSSNLNNVASQVAQMISKLTIALTLYIGAKLVIEGDLTVGQLVAFNMLGGRVSGPVLRLASLWHDFQQARISVERLGDILNTATEPGRNPNRPTPPPIKGAIEIDNVTFRYRPDGPEILRRISLEVPPGQLL